MGDCSASIDAKKSSTLDDIGGIVDDGGGEGSGGETDEAALLADFVAVEMIT